MLNPPPDWPLGPLPAALGDAEPGATGSRHVYDHDAPPQRVGDVAKHRYMLPYDIGVWTNGTRGGALTPGLAQFQTQTIDVDQTPDFWEVVLDTEVSAGTVAVRVYLGSGVGGPFFRLGSKGKLKIPAQGQNAITLQNLGVGNAFGTVVAVKGFDPAELDYQG